MHEPLNRTSSRIVRVAAASGLAQKFRIAFAPDIQYCDLIILRFFVGILEGVIGSIQMITSTFFDNSGHLMKIVKVFLLQIF